MSIASAPPPAPPKERFRFTLRRLLAAITVICVLLAAIYWLARLAPAPLLVFVLAFGVVASVALLSLGQYRQAIEALTVMGIVIAVVALILPEAVFPPPRRSPKLRCQSNLKQLGISLWMYHDRYGSFPPAYIADEAGRPMHSWRVLLLPFCDHQALYDRYNFDEPWDGPNNRLLSEEVSQPYWVYSCPGENHSVKTDTSYLAVIGPGTAWQGERPVRMKDIRDGSSNTILLVEVHNSGIHWMEPRDLHISQMAPAINAPRGQGISSPHPGGAAVVFADGSVHFLEDNLDPETLRALLTIAGGENIKLP